MRLPGSVIQSPRSEEVTLDALCGAWRIFQKKKGHRYNTDDLLTAWFAARMVQRPRRILDLGTGIGSVALMLTWKFPRAMVLGVEAQEESAALALRSAAVNGVSGRVRVRVGDLRNGESLAGENQFDLVTATPPYIPPGRGAVSPVPQRAYARLELRGDIRDYCRAAGRVLAPRGRFVTVFAADQRIRAEEAGREAGLYVVRRCDVVMREGREPFLTLLAMARLEKVHQNAPLVECLTIRDTHGWRTPEYRRIRVEMGMPEG